MKRIITKMYLCLLAFCIAGGISAQTQNSMTEVIPFKTIDGKIIVEAAINGEVADFVLDLSGHNALLPEALKKLRIDMGRTVLLVLIRILYSNKYLLEKYMKWQQLLLATTRLTTICLLSLWKTNHICASWE